MLGISLTKLLFTVAVIFGVWKGFRFYEAWQKKQVAEDQNDQLKPSQPSVEELAECTICGTYVPTRGAAPCDRPNCPQST
jgi:hypothetical protein